MVRLYVPRTPHEDRQAQRGPVHARDDLSRGRGNIPDLQSDG